MVWQVSPDPDFLQGLEELVRALVLPWASDLRAGQAPHRGPQSSAPLSPRSRIPQMSPERAPFGLRSSCHSPAFPQVERLQASEVEECSLRGCFLSPKQTPSWVAMEVDCWPPLVSNWAVVLCPNLEEDKGRTPLFSQ